MERNEQGEQLRCAEPRAAAAAAPHKRQAVAAGTAVGEAGGEGGKSPAGEAGGSWTTVLSRRARRQERAQLGVSTGSAARKAAAARAAATQRTAAAILEHYGMGK